MLTPQVRNGGEFFLWKEKEVNCLLSCNVPSKAFGIYTVFTVLCDNSKFTQMFYIWKSTFVGQYINARYIPFE